MLFSSIVLAFLLPVAHAAVVRTPHDHDKVNSPLPGVWYQEPDHPVHSLFRRAPDATNYPPVGTPEWSAGFPPAGGAPNPNLLPQSWIAALNAAVAAGKIPDIPLSTNTPNTSPVYPQGTNPNSPQICSSTYRCRIPGDIWDAPDGIVATSFDDGPLPPTPQLVDFLRTNNLRTTFFMIGVNILYYPSQFVGVFNASHDIAVHTWSHPYMTTLGNMDVLGQLGWTMQLIHNSTGGRVPRYWRPPYGDSDMRVSSIAKEVFGLETVIWNSDSSDWSAPSQQQVVDTIGRYLSGPKSPGLLLLEHTTSAITVGGFIAAFPLFASNGWTFRSMAEVIGGGQVYQNANSSSSVVTSKDILLNLPASTTTSTSTTLMATPSPTTAASAVTTSPVASKKSSAVSVPSLMSWTTLVFIMFCSNFFIFS